MLSIFLQKIKLFINHKKAIAVPALGFSAIIIVVLIINIVDTRETSNIKSKLQICADNAVIAANTVDQNILKRIFAILAAGAEGQTADNNTLEYLSVPDMCHKLYHDCLAPHMENIRIVNDFSCDYKTQTLTLEDSTTQEIKTLDLYSNVVLSDAIEDTSGELIKTLEISASSMSNIDPIDVVFTYPYQGTVCASTSLTADGTFIINKDSECMKYKFIKGAITESLINLQVMAGAQPERTINVGILPYNYTVTFPEGFSIPSTMTHNEDASFFQNSDVVDAFNPLQRYDEAYAAYLKGETYKRFLDQPKDVAAWGRVDIALHTAAEMFKQSPGSSNENKPTQKNIILLSDGTNVGCCYTNHPKGNFENQYIYQYKPYVDHMKNVCEELKQSGVKIFTVYLKPEIDAGATNEMSSNFAAIEQMFADCASDNSLGKPGDTCAEKNHCFIIENNKDIMSTYQEIMSTFIKPDIFH